MLGPGAFRWLLAMIVVLHHTTPLRFGAWAVYVFFILSGYWIARMWDEKYRQTRTPILTFLVSRWWRLAPVLFGCLCLTVGLSWLFRWPLPPPTVPWALRQIPIWGSTFDLRLLPPQWSIDVEMQFYAAAALLLPALGAWRGTEKSSGRLLLAVALAMGASTGVYLASGGSPDLPYLWSAAGFFLVGVWMWRSNWAPSSRFSTLTVVGFIGGCVLLVFWPNTRSALVHAGGDPPVLRFAHWPALWQVVGSLLFVPFLARNVRLPSPQWDRLMGNWAYPLYLLHWLPREWYYRQVDWALGGWHNAVLWAINILIALGGSLILLWLIDRPMDRIRSRWVTSRKLILATGTPTLAAPNDVPNEDPKVVKQVISWIGP